MLHTVAHYVIISGYINFSVFIFHMLFTFFPWENCMHVFIHSFSLVSYDLSINSSQTLLKNLQIKQQQQIYKSFSKLFSRQSDNLLVSSWAGCSLVLLQSHHPGPSLSSSPIWSPFSVSPITFSFGWDQGFSTLALDILGHIIDMGFCPLWVFSSIPGLYPLD